ncbi:pyroglutamylated RF-amide peptide receptor isoform X2 [Hypomesus transpacificus]|uniref:pyroglutamylated RF-amide peptide receptor isoform X2 n=1 Tax=Hypomesus transpacificus TaxID=137520 RepID=UPI001F086D0D|nr:pyroglutamylated RF-amide peptide receptor isoform X2 [Hypomesus transpacificus]
MAASTEMGSTKITPEALKEMLQYYNLTRQEFIDSYNIQPLVYIPELPNISSEWLGGVLVCKTVPFVQTTAIVTGILTMTCIAIERYQGIVYPLKMRRQYTPKRAYRMLGLVWIASVMVGSPMLFVQQLEVKYDFLYDQYHVCCQESWRSLTHRQVYTTFIMVALFLLPLAAMLFLYTRIGIELWIRKRIGDSSVLSTMNHREINKISRKKKRAVKMMITIVLLFTICWAPFHTVHMLFEYNDLEKKHDEVTVNMIIAIVQAIGFFNSFNNPIVYAFMNENFKKSCVSTLSRCLRKRTQQRGVVEGPNLSVQFIKPLNRQAFLETGKCDILMHQPVGTGPSLSSNRETSSAFTGERMSTVHSELPACSSSMVK